MVRKFFRPKDGIPVGEKRNVEGGTDVFLMKEEKGGILRPGRRAGGAHLLKGRKKIEGAGLRKKRTWGGKCLMREHFIRGFLFRKKEDGEGISFLPKGAPFLFRA